LVIFEVVQTRYFHWNNNKEIVSAVDTVLNKLPGAREALDQTRKKKMIRLRKNYYY
jgi:hypothetical protein